jgi:hypothetical protein
VIARQVLFRAFVEHWKDFRDGSADSAPTWSAAIGTVFERFEACAF